MGPAKEGMKQRGHYCYHQLSEGNMGTVRSSRSWLISGKNWYFYMKSAI